MLQLHMWAFKDIFATQKVGLGGVAYIYMVYVCVYVCIYIYRYIKYIYIHNENHHHTSHITQVERVFRQKRFKLQGTWSSKPIH